MSQRFKINKNLRRRNVRIIGPIVFIGWSYNIYKNLNLEPYVVGDT